MYTSNVEVENVPTNIMTLDELGIRGCDSSVHISLTKSSFFQVSAVPTLEMYS